MIKRVLVRKGRYCDSAVLMRLSKAIGEIPGVAQATSWMGTPANAALLARSGYPQEELVQLTAVDLLVSLELETNDALAGVDKELSRLLEPPPGKPGEEARTPPRAVSIALALSERPEVNLVSVAVPGSYAAYVTERALEAGKHVFLFSNNVALEDELRLKRLGREKGLLVMGPDCGTSILAGVGLGFANRVRRGRVGIVGASGTGIQEISSQIHALGEGISQAIGIGGRDLSLQISGLMADLALALLQADPRTEVIVLVAKKPAAAVASRLASLLGDLGKPVVVRYLGETVAPASSTSLTFTGSLLEAARVAVGRLSGRPVQPLDPRGMAKKAGALLGRKKCLTGRLVGLFSGGSLALETAQLLGQAGVQVRLAKEIVEPGPTFPGQGHLIVDTGDDGYTQGKPHPMVDQTVRIALMQTALRDPAVALLLIDVVLGDGAHPDPASELAAALGEGQKARRAPVLAIASITGTELDPQDRSRQHKTLEEAGFQVMPSAAEAALLAAALLATPAHKPRKPEKKPHKPARRPAGAPVTRKARALGRALSGSRKQGRR